MHARYGDAPQAARRAGPVEQTNAPGAVARSKAAPA